MYIPTAWNYKCCFNILCCILCVIIEQDCLLEATKLTCAKYLCTEWFTCHRHHWFTFHWYNTDSKLLVNSLLSLYTHWWQYILYIGLYNMLSRCCVWCVKIYNVVTHTFCSQHKHIYIRAGFIFININWAWHFIGIKYIITFTLPTFTEFRIIRSTQLAHYSESESFCLVAHHYGIGSFI